MHIFALSTAQQRNEEELFFTKIRSGVFCGSGGLFVDSPSCMARDGIIIEMVGLFP